MAIVNPDLDPDLIVVGACARAAVFSALRAGLRPGACDLFGDRDLRAVCPFIPLRHEGYPETIVEALEVLPPLPVLYTGGLENHPRVVDSIARRQTILGNPGQVLRRARDPWGLREVLSAADLHYPEIRRRHDPPLDPDDWLEKPLRSCGGGRIRPAGTSASARGVYFQRRVEGTPVSVVFVAQDDRATLLGASRQLVGEPWLHASPFAYCGSIGALNLRTAHHLQVEAAGNALASAFHLRGLFGLDLVLEAERAWTIEINPRYTASVEVLEHVSGVRALELHLRACGWLGPPDAVAAIPEPHGRDQTGRDPDGPLVVGKGILYAPHDLQAGGEFDDVAVTSPWNLSRLADIPARGAYIRRGRPVLSFFARAATIDGCLEELEKEARELSEVVEGWGCS